MKIYFMQHGKAQPEEKDPEESLSADGKDQIVVSARALNKMDISLDLIVCSSKKRSKETAVIIAKHLKYSKELLETDMMKAKTSAEETLRFLQNHIDKEHVFIAGHLPSIQEIISYLLSSTSIQITIQNGGCSCIESKDLMSYSGNLLWHLLPEHLKLIIT